MGGMGRERKRRKRAIEGQRDVRGERRREGGESQKAASPKE